MLQEFQINRQNRQNRGNRRNNLNNPTLFDYQLSNVSGYVEFDFENAMEILSGQYPEIFSNISIKKLLKIRKNVREYIIKYNTLEGFKLLSNDEGEKEGEEGDDYGSNRQEYLSFLENIENCLLFEPEKSKFFRYEDFINFPNVFNSETSISNIKKILISRKLLTIEIFEKFPFEWSETDLIDIISHTDLPVDYLASFIDLRSWDYRKTYSGRTKKNKTVLPIKRDQPIIKLAKALVMRKDFDPDKYDLYLDIFPEKLYEDEYHFEDLNYLNDLDYLQSEEGINRMKSIANFKFSEDKKGFFPRINITQNNQTDRFEKFKKLYEILHIKMPLPTLNPDFIYQNRKNIRGKWNINIEIHFDDLFDYLLQNFVKLDEAALICYSLSRRMNSKFVYKICKYLSDKIKTREINYSQYFQIEGKLSFLFDKNIQMFKNLYYKFDNDEIKNSGRIHYMMLPIFREDLENF